jgi:hypothetical protein
MRWRDKEQRVMRAQTYCTNRYEPHAFRREYATYPEKCYGILLISFDLFGTLSTAQHRRKFYAIVLAISIRRLKTRRRNAA